MSSNQPGAVQGALKVRPIPAPGNARGYVPTREVQP